MSEDTRLLDYLKRVTADLRRTRAELSDLRARESEPVAIVGMGCRAPGGVDAPEALWRLLDGGTDVIGGMPSDRGWDLEALAALPGGTRSGGFLEDVSGFDADFFGISPREAAAMDPQQRLMLEVSWEAVERAGIDPASLAGTPTGVFTGISVSDYAGASASGALPVPEEAKGYLLTGTATSVVSGRVAYTLGLSGPALTVDTACSSSLVALHLAVLALRRGECSLALAGGATVMSGPALFSEFARQGGLAADGRCKSFGEGADGAGFAEGVGALVLERLSDARRHGRRVLAVIRGSAVNQDGASNGLTAPSGPAQVRVVRAALADAGLAPDDVDAVEGHGTGTELGDPIEAEALAEVFGAGRSSRPVHLGSVKSNIGHTQAAAGVVGVMKMVLALQHEALPASLHSRTPSPLVDWSSGRLSVLSEPVPWPRGERVRRAGVSAFGISGTNAHLILEEAPEGAPEEDAGPGPERPEPGIVGGPPVWTLSARDPRALREQAARLRDRLRELPGSPGAAEVAWSLCSSRTLFAHRAAVIGSGPDQLMERLDALAAGDRPEGVVTGTAPGAGRASAPVFVFPGQGGQWEGMARGLLESSRPFAEAVAECERALAPFVDWSLTAVLRGAPGAPAVTGQDARVDVVQPVLWAVMVSLARLWRAAGVEPSAVVGHSQGEIAAACVAGALTLEDGARVVALRSLALREIAGHGGMAALALAPAEAAERITPWRGRISVAAVNGPGSTVVSGDEDAVTELVRACEADGVRARRVDVDYASHSDHVERVADRLRADLAPVRPTRGRVPFHSTVAPGPGWAPGELPDTEPVDGASLDAGYWYRNLRHPVLFAPVVDRLARQSATFVEVGPHPVLTLAIEQTLEERGQGDHSVLATLRRGEDGPLRFRTALAEAHCRGAGVDWGRVLGGANGAPPVELPTYPFQRRRYWLSVPHTSGDTAELGLERSGHPLIGARVPVADTGQTLFTGVLDTAGHPWLAEHRVGGRALVPGTAVVELLLYAGRECGCPEIADLVVLAPLELPGESGRGTRVQITVDAPGEGGRRAVRVRSLPRGEDSWTLHAQGELAPSSGGPAAAPVAAPGADAVPVPTEDGYAFLSAHGYDYGPAFRGLRAAWADASGVWAETELDPLPGDAAAMAGPHPALADAGLHALLLHDLAERSGRALRLPFSWSGVRLHPARTPSRTRVRITRTGTDTYSVVYADADGAPILSIDALTVREAPAAADTAPNALFQQEWHELTAPGRTEGPPRPDTWALVGALGEGRAGHHPDAHALVASLDRGAPAPGLVLLPAGGGEGPPDGRTRAGLHRVLESVRTCLDDERLAAARIVVVTTGAVDPLEAGSGAAHRVDLAGAAVWGLVASAETENPGRFLLLDTDRFDLQTVADAVRTGEPRVAVRDGRLYAPRLADASPGGEGLVPPQRRSDWRLESREPGRVDGLALVPYPEQLRPLETGEVRVAVRAAGVNFRDVLMTVGMHPEPVSIGHEGAGTVIEVGPDVHDLAPGDRVMGLFPGAFAPVAVAPRGFVAPVPEGWDDAFAAAVPAVYLTVHIALVEEAGLGPGDRVLIHSAAGGVGQAAVHLARHLGARVLATASPEKWDVLREAGIADEHIAHSRRLDFEERFRAAGPVDVVLNSLTGEAIDASLRLMAPGGSFVELGHNELRDPGRIASEHGGVRYRTVDLSTLPAERVQRAFNAILPLLEKGELPGVPVTRYPVERAVEAFRLMQHGRNVGKIVLDMATRFRPGGTVLVTGGTGTLGALVARHLVVRHGVTSLVLTGRRGRQAPGAADLAAELASLGARVEITACDVSDPGQVRALVDGVPAGHPLTGVVHAAGVVDDATVTRLTPESLERVLAPKVDGAWNLHEATAGLDLDAFVLFSSAAGVLGSAGQAGYAAANSFLDALARHRRSLGLPAQSLSWGRWADRSAMTAHLGDADDARMSRMWGVEAISADEGCALMDAAADTGLPHVLPVPMALSALRARASSANGVPALLRGLVRPSAPVEGDRARDTAAVLRTAGEGPERRALLEELIGSRAAQILGHPSGHRVDPEQDFLESGFDSLTAVELRNHLQEATGLRLPAGLVFNHRTPVALSAYLDGRMGTGHAGTPEARLDPEAPKAPERTAPAAGPVASAAPASHGDLVELFREACRDGRPEDAVTLARIAARGRPVLAPGDAWPVAPTRLSSGGEAPALICFPSLVMTSGAQEFARFAAFWRGRRSVHALPAPGFLAGEALPADRLALVRAQADAALRAATGRPFFLVGRSSGGWLAHAVAEELHERGLAPAGLVLLDTPVPDEPGVLPIVTESVTERADEFAFLDADRVTAMGAYLAMFADWRPGSPVCPVTQVRPTSPVRGSNGAALGLGWEWPRPHGRVEVPGDHLTMMEEHAGTTAAAVEEALARPQTARGGRSMVRRLRDRVRDLG
ncbi:SDR family NAD(P)-dependent oxidoreductase [Nocardiopsis dassonvillei]|uniref:type I polyketide synthase n=1 Tax=Nocardiopsis dassonvillei TaxID=2014 RepID=UPI0020A590BB|nr:type I polyketide synthase [Nocardiopsis dassonvillei]MCP3016381.1 SDR family NAD(P)-dependent oxidoreductase [Nocardiopsis dassonvillei]